MWENNSAYALLKSYRITGAPKIFESVQRWADDFVPFLIKHNLPRRIKVSTDGTYKMSTCSQIAYGISSLYRGMKSLAEIFGKPEYKMCVEKIFDGFNGDNIANTPMYNPKTGQCFDGINSQDEVKFNFGAESTIEELLAIQKRGLSNIIIRRKLK